MARQTSTPLMPGIIRSVTPGRAATPEDLQALFGIVGGAHVIALRGERGAQHARDLRFVVDNQNSAGHDVSSFLFHRKITSSGLAGMISGDEDHGRALRFARDSSLVCGNADGGGDHVCCWSGWAPTRRRRGWCFWCWWCGRHPGRDLAFAVYRGALRALVRLLFSASVPHASAGRRAGMGGHDSFVACCLVVGRVAERARARPGRPSSGARTWSGSTS
jgi:hypothetical protein